MVTIDKKWECWGIAHNDQYIATIGNGVTVWNRATLDLVHHFAGMRWIHGGIFVNDDVLMVKTFLLSNISEKATLGSSTP